jgi:AcrR family transcriptional regulator
MMSSSRAPARTRGWSVAVMRETPRARVVEIQRMRLLGAALRAVDELGYSHTTVAHVTSRARVSRRTFYDLFENREDCLLAALESVVEQIGSELAVAHPEGSSWRERVRMGLWTILSFFDREPVLARVCVVQALRGGPRVLERRERVLAELADVVDEGRLESSRTAECPPLTAEGLAGAAFTIVYGRLLRAVDEPLTGVFGELMGMIVLPYLGPAAARRERDRPAPTLDAAPGLSGVVSTRAEPGGGGGDVLAGLPMRLTYRTARVLETIAQRSGVSNRQAGELAGVADQGQISKLLSRLERLGLIENAGEGHVRGERNAWTLTHTGMHVAQSIRAHAPDREEGSS